MNQTQAHARITYNGDPVGGSNYLALACGDGSGGYSSDTDGDLWVSDTGAVGIGTGAPDESSAKNYSVAGMSLTVQGEAGLPLNTNTETQDASLRIQATADNVMDMGCESVSPFAAWIQVTNRDNLSLEYPLLLNPNGGNVGINKSDPSHPIHTGGDAYVTTGGVWTNSSSRAVKKNIKSLSEKDADAAFAMLDPKKFQYKSSGEEHLGFIAEDVHDLVATEDRKGLSPMDIIAVLTKVMQKQNKTLDKQNEALSKQQKQISKLEKALKDKK